MGLFASLLSVDSEICFFGKRYKRKTKKQRKCREFIPYQSVVTLLAPRPFAVPVRFGVNEPLVAVFIMKADMMEK